MTKFFSVLMFFGLLYWRSYAQVPIITVDSISACPGNTAVISVRLTGSNLQSIGFVMAESSGWSYVSHSGVFSGATVNYTPGRGLAFSWFNGPGSFVSTELVRITLHSRYSSTFNLDSVEILDVNFITVAPIIRSGFLHAGFTGSVIQPPIRLSGRVGDTLFITAGAGGTTAYQWQRRHQGIWQDLQANSQYRNVNSDTMGIYGIQSSMAGEYYRLKLTAGSCSQYTDSVRIDTAGCNASFSTLNVSICSDSTLVFNGIARSQSGIYLDTLLNSLLCDSFITLNLTVQPVPSAGLVNGSTVVCVGGNTTLSAVSGGGTWSSRNPGIASVNPTTGVVTGLTPGVAIIVYTRSASGVCARAITETSVNVSPASNSGVLTAPASVCLGSNAQLTSTVAGGLWSTSNAQVATISSTGLLTAVSLGNVVISYTVTGTGGCPNAIASQSITIVSPTAAAVLNGLNQMCVGSTQTLSASVPGGIWSSSNPTVCTVQPTSGILTAVALGNASITYTLGGSGTCSNAVSSINVSVVGSLSAGTISGASSLCVSRTALFTSTAAGGVWSSSDNTRARVNAVSGLVTALSAGVVQIRYSIPSSGNCSASVVASQLSVFSAPVATVQYGGSLNFCAGDSVILTGSLVAGAFYRWLRDNDSIPGANSRIFIARQTGIYRCRVFFQNGCSDTSAPLQVNVTPVISAGLTMLPSPGACVGDTVLLTAQPSGVDYLYQWFQNGVPIQGVSSATLPIVQPGAYRVRISTVSGCFDTSAAVSPLFSAQPNVSISPTDTLSVCEGSFVTINSQADSGVTYQWILNGLDLLGQNGNSLTVSQAGSYALRVTKNGCSRSSNVLVIQSKVSPVAGITANGSTSFCLGGSVSLLASPDTGAYSYRWLRNGIPYANQIQSTFTANQSGSYRVIVSATNGCADTSESVAVTVYSQPTPDTQTVYLCTGSMLPFCYNNYNYSTIINCTLTDRRGCDSLVVLQLIVADTIRVTVRRNICAPDSFLFGPNYLKVSGNYIRRFVAQGGCDSIVTLQLVVGESSSSSDTVTICSPGSYMFNGLMLSTAGVYRDTLENDSGCDSIVTLVLNVNQPSTTSLVSSICERDSFCFDNRCYGQSGVYSDTLSGVNGCDSIVNLTLSVVSRPVAGFTFVGDTTFCSGSSLLLTANPGTGISCSWIRNGIVVGQPGNSFSATQSGIYRAVFTNNTTQCRDTSSQSVVVVVNALPTISLVAAGATLVCPGNQVMLYATSSVTGGVYRWYRNDTLIPNALGVTYPAIAPGDYRVSVTGGPGNCTGTSGTVNVSNYPAPSIDIQALGLTSFCMGGYVDLTASVLSGFTYQWLVNGTTIVGAVGPIYRAVSAGVYSLRATHIATGCIVNTQSVNVSVFANPTASLNFTGVVNRCTGDSVLLRVSSSGGEQFQWYEGSLLLTGQTFDSLWVTQSGLYSVRVSNALGCAVTPMVQVIVSSLPAVSVTAGGSTSICGGDSVALTASLSTGVVYQWFLNNSPISGATGRVFFARQPGSYSVRVTTPQGCTGGSSPLVISLLGSPSVGISAGGPTTICSGDSVLLQVTTISGASVQWYRNDTSLAGQNGSSLRAFVSGRYRVRVQSPVNGCYAISTEVIVIVHPTPTVQLIALGSTQICSGGSVVLSANASQSTTFVWERDGVSLPGQSGATLVATVAGLYRVRATAANTGCFGISDTIRVVVSPQPNALVTVQGRARFCRGDSVVLSAIPVTGASYQWIYNGALLAGQNGSSLVVRLNSGSYRVRVSTGPGCFDTSLAVEVTVLNLPSSPSISISNTRDTLFSTIPNGNRWYRNGQLLAQDTLRYLIITQNGQYCARIINADSCLSDCSPTLLVSNVGIIDEQVYHVRVYPNPSDGNLSIDLTGFDFGEVELGVFNSLGQCVRKDVFAIEKREATWHVKLTDLESGLYWLRIGQLNRVIQQRIVIYR